MICPTCSWPMVTQEAKAGFLVSSCVNNTCARVCYIPLKEEPGFHIEPFHFDPKAWNKRARSLKKKRHTTVSAPSLSEMLALDNSPKWTRGGCF